MAKKRFSKVADQKGIIGRNIEVWVDENTGVQYLFMEGENNYGGGLCVLVDKDGKPLLYK